MLRSTSESVVRVLDITLGVQQHFGKTVDRVTFAAKAGTFNLEIPVSISPGDRHKQTFDPVLELPVQDNLTISIHYPTRSLRRSSHSVKTITVKLSKVDAEARDDQRGRKLYSTGKSHKDVEVIISIATESFPSNIYQNPRDVPSTEGAQASSQHVAPERSPDLKIEIGNETSRGALATVPLIENVHGSTLPPITSDVLKICPRFRLLVIGNTGVGKSTLIRGVFGVEDVNVSNDKRGQADIEREFVAKENGLFVVHDSLGLEAGDGDNTDTIKRFIAERRTKTDIKDRLHAVWVCLPVPYAKGRLLETGMEDFLRHRKEILGDIPIVVVLTKADLLDKQLLFTFSKTGAVKTVEEAIAKVDKEKPQFLNEYCTKPLQEIAGDIPHVPISATEGLLDPTIPRLVKTTTSEIERYIIQRAAVRSGREESLERNAPLYLAEMAQRASIEANVSLTIKLGRQRYWKNLGASIGFSEEKVKKYLLVIHEDIVRGWNFSDPDEVLQGDDFKAALLDTTHLGVDHPRGAREEMGFGDGVASVLDIIPAVCTLPIVGANKLAELCMDAFKSSQFIIMHFMAYITDLVYVMKILFILTPQRSITPENTALAVKVYEESKYRNKIHLEIRNFNAYYKTPPGRDLVMEKIEEMIGRYSVTDEEVARLRKRIVEKMA